MYQGEVTFDKKTFQKLGKPPKKSLEDYINRDQLPYHFLIFPKNHQMKRISGFFGIQ